MLNRRDLLKLFAASAGAASGVRLDGPAFSAALGLAATSFQYGVASGDPLPHAVIIWTRVTPDPSATPGSGQGATTAVQWRVCHDRTLTDLVAAGTVNTDAASDHTVKVDVTGLAASTTYYYYEFSVGSESSPVGATRTAPAPSDTGPRLRFGFVSCANYAAGYFTPYKFLATRCDLDFVLHVGDYTYEYGDGGFGSFRKLDPSIETITLAQYRKRQALYKADPDLQALHQTVPWITTIDDHETADNAWRDGAVNHDPSTEGMYRDRRNAAYQAYREWMPIRVDAPSGSDGTQWYRRFTWGTLADITMLDLRQYRDKPVAPTDLATETTSMIGAAQQAWITDALRVTTPRWRLIGNSVQFMKVVYPYIGPSGFPKLTDQTALNTDAWDGYPTSRAALQEVIAAHATNYDVVFLTGDIHSSWAAELPAFAAPPVAAGYTPLAVEFVSTSITSDGFGESIPAALLQQGLAFIMAANPHVKFLEGTKHGCCIVDVTHDRVQCDWHYTTGTNGDPRTDTSATVQPGASWHTQFGTKRVESVNADRSPASVIDDCTLHASTTAVAPSTTAPTGTTATTTPLSSSSSSGIALLVTSSAAAAIAVGAAGAFVVRRRRAQNLDTLAPSPAGDASEE